MNLKPFQISAYLQKFSSFATGGMKFEFVTQENIDPESLLKIMKSKDQIGFLTFNKREIENEDIACLIGKKIDFTKYDQGKSPSQILRNVLFRIHEKKGGKKEDFINYYNSIMTSLIEQYKQKLNDLD